MKERILQAVKDAYGYTLEDMKGHSRKREFVIVKQVTQYLLAIKTGHSLEYIGDMFGCTHCNVIYSRDTTKVRLRLKEPLTTSVLRQIEDAMQPPTRWIGASTMPVNFKETLIG